MVQGMVNWSYYLNLELMCDNLFCLFIYLQNKIEKIQNLDVLPKLRYKLKVLLIHFINAPNLPL